MVFDLKKLFFNHLNTICGSVVTNNFQSLFTPHRLSVIHRGLVVISVDRNAKNITCSIQYVLKPSAINNHNSMSPV